MAVNIKPKNQELIYLSCLICDQIDSMNIPEFTIEQIEKHSDFFNKLSAIVETKDKIEKILISELNKFLKIGETQ